MHGTVSVRSYKFTFRFVVLDGEQRKHSEVKTEWRPRSTMCVVERYLDKPNELGEHYSPAGMGRAVCSEHDQFSYAYGRYLSFRRAVEGMYSDIASALWKEYRRMFPNDIAKANSFMLQHHYQRPARERKNK